MPVAENTNYRGRQILIGFQKDLVGNMLSKAIDLSAFAEEVTITDNFNMREINPVNNNGQNAGSVVGDAVFEGNLNLNTARALSSMFMAAIIGKAPTFAFGPKVASSWATATAHMQGDVVKLTTGEYLVAQNNGTTGATEPVITTETDWDNLALDGTVLWKLRTTLYEAGDYETNFCTEKMVIIERNAEGCGGVNVFDRILEGVELTYYAVQKDDGVIVSTQNIPFMAIKERRSSEPGFEDITVTNVIKPREDYFTAENVLIRVDGQKYGTLLNFMLEYTRNVTMRTSTEPNERIVVVDKPTFAGSGTIKLDPAEYELLRKISTKSITISMNGYDGETVNITVPKTQFINPTINKEGSREFWMDFTLNPTGNLDNAMAKVDITTAINFN